MNTTDPTHGSASGKKQHLIQPLVATSSRYRKRRKSILFLGVFVTLAALSLCLSPLRASSTEVLYSFTDGDDGEYPDTDVAIDAAGNL